MARRSGGGREIAPGRAYRTDAVRDSLFDEVMSVQGTVATFDAQRRSGTLLLDDGSELAFPTAAFDASGLRLLRLGQRVRVDRDESGTVTKVTLPTIV